MITPLKYDDDHYLTMKAEAMGVDLKSIDYKAWQEEIENKEQERQNALKNETIIKKFEDIGVDSTLLNHIKAINPSFYLDFSKNTLLSGAFGVGKTWGVLKNLYRSLQTLTLRGLSQTKIAYVPFYRAFDLKYAHPLEFQALKMAKILIIDEFATLSTLKREDLSSVTHDILDSRYLRGLKTILITNSVFKMIANSFEPSIVSRLKDFEKININGEDRRGKNQYKR